MTDLAFEVPHFADGMCHLTTYEDISAVLASTSFSVQRGSDPRFVDDTLVNIDGEHHLRRRRLENQLFTAAHRARYEREVLVPLVDRYVDEIEAGCEQGQTARVDLVELGLTLLVHIAAAITGLDGIDTADDARRLLHFADSLALSTNAHFTRLGTAEQEALIEEGLAERQVFVDELFAPSVERRRALLAGLAEGTVHEFDVPHDLITLFLKHQVEDHTDDLLLRELSIYLHASIRTSTRMVCHSFEHLFGWIEAHSEDRDAIDDPIFLRAVIEETMRMHVVLPLLLRRALEDFEVPSGRAIKEGEMVALLFAEANRDPAVWGPSADVFDPRREAPDRMKQYGLAFGAGEHLCIGKRTALGGGGPASDPTLGSVLLILTRILRAGGRLDPDSPPVMNAGSYYDEHLTFPIVFAPRSS